MRLIFFLLVIYCLPLKAQLIDSKQKIIAQYDSVLQHTPREKLYVHFDKSTYLPIDTIWFKAYLIDASVHNPSSLSGLIYTDIINEKGEIVKSLSLPTVLGLTWGSFVINQDQYKPGNYTFRAYTNWMQNFGDTHFFKRVFKILPVLNTQIETKSSVASPKVRPKPADSSVKEKLRDIDAQFLPEGGNYLANRSQKIAFKVLNTLGKGIAVTGEIVDSKQNVVLQFVSNDKGMGYFNLLPQNDEVYNAKINYKGLTKTIQLPKAKTDGVALKVENEYLADTLSITVFSTNDLLEFTLIGQARGLLSFVADVKFNNTKSKTFKIAKSTFPTGVCQIILLDEKNKIVNERNFFINHHDELKLNISTLNTSYYLRDSIPVQIKVSDAAGKPTSSSLSIAITDDHQVAKDSVDDLNILSYFLMHSDLKGEIEKPGYYFHHPNKQKHNELEALMLTQGWVSYDWDLMKKPLFKAEKEYAFSGTITNVVNKPIANAKIMLLGTNKGFMMMDTITNEKGEFIFNKLPMMDSASFVIQALNAKGKKGTIGIVLNEFKPPLVAITPQSKSVFEPEQLDSVSENLIKTKVEEYKLTQRDGLLLNEVNIVGKRTIKGSKNLNGTGEADYIIAEEDLNKIAKKTLYDVLVEKVKGFRAGIARKSTNRIFYIHFNVLKLVIDGMEVDFFYTSDGGPDSYYHYIRSILDYYNAEDIKAIEVMQNRRYSSTYKSRYIDPMDEKEYSFLEITTRTGAGPLLKKSANMYLHKPMNYGDNRSFYNPKYTSANKSDKKPDFRSTIYWNPNLITNEKGEGDFSFFAADKPGSYTVWIEGMDMQGNFGFKTITLKIN